MTGAVRSGGFAERAAEMGGGLEVANAIRGYLQKAGGDARLALALSVADAMADINRADHARQGERVLPEDMH